MKILIVCQLYYPENVTVTNVAEGLAKLGHDVTVLAGKPNYDLDCFLNECSNIDYEVRNEVKIHRVDLVTRTKKRSSLVLNYLSFWKNSKKWVRKCKEKYDVVYTMSLSPVTMLAAGALYKKKHHVKYVVHCVDLWPESVVVTKAVKKDSLIYKILFKWSKKLYETADEILIGSPSFKDYFINELHIKNIPLKFVPQCSLVEGDYKENVELSNGFNIVYCGNIGNIQKVESIPEIMSYVTNPNIYFHIIGMGCKTDELLENIKKFNMENRIIYHGPKVFNESVKYINSADTLYVTLSREGYVGNTIPNKLTMYLTFAKPIITNLKGDGLKVAEVSGGSICCEDDPKLIAKAFDKISKMDKKDLTIMGENNKKYYYQNSSSEKITSMIEKELFDNLCN